MKHPTRDKFVYNLHALPSTIENFHNSSDIKKFRLEYKKLMKIYKKWLETSIDPQHGFTPTAYPLTSGELAMIQLQKEHVQKNKPKRKNKNNNSNSNYHHFQKETIKKKKKIHNSSS